MRAARRSGPDGLSGMAAVVELPELRLLRPLLGVARSRLGATLRSRGVRWLDDPSNLDPRFERVRVRLAAPPRTAGTEPAVRHAREAAVAEAAVALLEFDEPGAVAFDKDAFARLPSDLRTRLLSRIVQGLGGREHPPRQDRLAAACQRLCRPESRGKSGRAADFTLSGCRLMLRSTPRTSEDRGQPAGLMSGPPRLLSAQAPARGPGREVSHARRLRWIVWPENGRNGRKPLFPAAFFAHFACSVSAATHLECNSTPTDIGQ
jgi:tRNA(Ile)-lysidine synthase